MIQSIETHKLKPNDWNPNHLPEAEIKRMAERFRETGNVDKPLTVRPAGDDLYEVLDGEQTLKAATKAGFGDVPCIVIEADDATAIATTFVKNLHGEMNSLKIGRNIVRMKEVAGDLPNTQIAKLMNKTEGTVRNYLQYVELADLIAAKESRDGWPTEDEIAALGVKEVRKLIDEIRQGTAQPLPLETADGENVAEAMDREEKEAKAFDRTLKALAKLTPDQKVLMRKELNKLIRLDGEAAEAAKLTPFDDVVG